jgi:hypothetical protein
MKGKEGAESLKTTIELLNKHFGEIGNAELEVKKQWLITVYQVAMQKENGSAGLQKSFSVEALQPPSIKEIRTNFYQEVRDAKTCSL